VLIARAIGPRIRAAVPPCPVEQPVMSKFKSDFLRTLDERGFIHQISDDTGLDRLFQTETVSAYIGFDPTASSLHVGSLIQIMMLHWMQQDRPQADRADGRRHRHDRRPVVQGRGAQASDRRYDRAEPGRHSPRLCAYLSFGDGPTDARMVNNADWLLGINYVEFLRDVGRHFSVNRMLSFDSVKLRLDREQSLSFLEFNYMILQAYDFVELNKRYDVRLQMGGSDQWAISSTA
jgi:tyrosyl-tRNA synthetase